jgi:NADPH-dependent 2,4-dienoyl-CoA reductase/sulfur reductase-like enzyme/nitrite reductase/ring-hydroxylating ferredoxin subunit
MAAAQEAAGPDFAAGVSLADIADFTTVAGRVGEEPVLLSRRGAEFFAVGGACTHYGGNLAEGRISGDRVRCPLHHACFSLLSGEALEAPAFDALARWRVDVEDGRVFVRQRADEEPKPAGAIQARTHPGRIVIVGGGAAGFAAADMLRRRGFSGELAMLSADSAPPCDRPNLSKDYLAGTAPEEWIPLKGEDYYRERAIDLRLGVEIASIDPRARKVETAGGETVRYDALLLATGAQPIRLSGPGFDLANVYLLRSLADSRAIIAAAAEARSVAIVGASFIALEVAASLRARGLEVHVAAPEPIPMQRVLGPEIGAFVRTLHERQGVRFHLGRTAERFDGGMLHLNDSDVIAADFVVLGVGVRPNVRLAEQAGLAVGNGVVVDDRFRTSAPDVFAAGDVANYPDPRLGERIRVEHWVAAERQGQVAALNMLGEEKRFGAAPFFWSVHYDHSIRYVGHAPSWDAVEIDGSVDAADFTARYLRDGRLLAAASLGRDRESLDLHAEMELGIGD